MSDSYLVLDSLSKRFGDITAVDGVTLEIEEGEFLALLGPSGCGKTTTLRMLAGFWECDGGEIRIGGRRVEHLPPQERPTAMVFQDYALFPHMTVFENVAFGLRMRKTPKPEIAERVSRVLDMVHLPDIGKLYPGELSGGMKQRVALARSIVVNPDILLLDEPLSNLDAKLRNEMRVEIRRLHDEAGTTSVFVTHDLHEAFFLGDRVAVMNQGQIEQLGTPEEIFHRPSSRFVADFVGHTNIFEASVVAVDDEEVRLRTNDGLEIVAEAPRRSMVLRVGDGASIAVPSHAIEVLPEPPAAGSSQENLFQGVVDAYGYLGSVVQLMVTVGSDMHFEVESSSERSVARVDPGTSLWFRWDASESIVLPLT